MIPYSVARKILLDFLPALLFFVVYQIYDIFVASGVAIVVAIAQGIGQWIKTQSLAPVTWFSAVLFTVLGGTTILFQDELYVKWKPTVVYLLLSGMFIASRYVVEKSAAEQMLGMAISLPSEMWQRINLAWSGFWLMMSGLNSYVALYFSTEIWMNYKTFGTLALTILFFVGQGFYIKALKHEAMTNNQGVA